VSSQGEALPIDDQTCGAVVPVVPHLGSADALKAKKSGGSGEVLSG
jgi:hypothetical protein